MSTADLPDTGEHASRATGGSDPQLRAAVAHRLVAVLQETSGFDADELDPSKEFLDLGLDSLFLIQLSETIRSRFGVAVTFRQLMGDLPNVAALAEYVAAHGDRSSLGVSPVRSSEANPVTDRAAGTVVPPMPHASPLVEPSADRDAANHAAALSALGPQTPDDQPPSMEEIFAQQCEVMMLQLQVLQERSGEQTPSRNRSDAASAPVESPKNSQSAEADDAPFPLTEAQLEIWLASQMSPQASCAYNQSLTFRLRGEFFSQHFAAAAHSVAARHEALRTAFDPDGQHQRIHSEPRVDVQQLDLSDQAPEQQESRISEIQRSVAEQPFDLQRGPLLKFFLIRLAEDRHCVVAAAHHIICDGWSWNVILREISGAYRALHERRDSDLPPAVSYREYSRRKMDGAGSEHRSRALQYWLDQYQELPEPLELPYDRPRPPAKTFRGATTDYRISPDLYLRLKKFAVANRTSLFSTALAAFNVLLARLSGQSDLVVTISSAGQAAKAENLVGHCVNLLPVRSRVDFDRPFSQLLSQTRDTVFDALEHQDCTLGTILRHLRLPRDAARLPLVDVNFNLYRLSPEIDFAGVPFSVAESPKQATVFDIFWNVHERDDHLHLFVDYSRDLFDEATILRWARHFEVLLNAIVQQPDAKIAQLALLDPVDRDELLVQRNDTKAVYPRASAVHQLFEQQAAATPDREAVVFNQRRLTYDQLNRRANQLARELGRRGVGRDDFVGIHLERSEQMVVAVLAALKAGAAYIPMDPTFPAERLSAMAEDAELRFVLTEQALSASSIAPNAETVYLDRDELRIASHDDSNLGIASDPDRLAYVIFTSGSTGRPKGVQIPHGALTNFLWSMRVAPGLTDSDTLVSVTTLSFDIAALELFLPLITGARLVILSRDDTLDGRRLAERLEQHEASVLQATPATWRLLIESGWSGKRGLKMLCGGEAMPPALADGLLARGSSLWNMYGPTETTIWSTVKRVENVARGNVSIGRPIANTQIYVLDAHRQPVPIGVAGRLFIGGDGLARGYLNRPELTAEKFIPHPFEPGKRIYDTGDQARYLPDGDIEFLGRLDHQVKIRGFRIELDEIEHALSQHPSVNQAVVVARDEDRGTADSGAGLSKVLVAYIVSAGPPASTLELREVLRKRLPEYMVPTAFVFLDTLPLTPNRKVDRKALPAPKIERATSESSYRPPRDALEMQIVNVWKKTLQVPQIGLDDNFFDLGGHSLLAARMIAEVEKVSGRRLPLATLLQAPTAAGFAECIRREDRQLGWQSLVPIRAGGSRPPLFCIHAAHGNVLLYRDLARHLGDEQPVYGLQCRGLDGTTPPHTTVEAMAADYVEEIRKIQPTGPYRLCGYCLGGTIAYEAAQQLQRAGETVDLLALFDTHSRWLDKSLLTRCYSTVQKVYYHTANIALSGRGGIPSFLNAKLHEATRRLRRRIAVGASRLAYALKLRDAPPLMLLERVNDRASAAYLPKPYAGCVTVFKPCKAYVGYEDPALGWGNGLAASVDVVELPVYPAGMLLEPFVADLAAALNERLQSASPLPAEAVKL